MALDNALFAFVGVTVSTTEISLTNGNTTIATQTTDAVISVWIDATAMAAGDQYEIALRERASTSGTVRRMVLGTLTGTQGSPIWISSPYQVGNAWDVTIVKIAGTDRSFSWSVRGVT